ncbi:hypothetical protein [Nocardiopsis rhodophaea]|uniref:hypothetical protein n=1 Tax=Nocardiopsis rhodophaea TaxID=280238 RepID=UPI0031DA6821
MTAMSACVIEEAERRGTSEDAEQQEVEESPKPPSSPAPEPEPEHEAKWTEDDVEYKLAVVDEGGYVPLDDPVIGDYARALDAAEEKCTQGREELGDISVRSVQLLDERGVAATGLSILEGIAESIPGEVEGPMDCRDVAASLVALMSEG